MAITLSVPTLARGLPVHSAKIDRILFDLIFLAKINLLAEINKKELFMITIIFPCPNFLDTK